jgi:hypothetical protein
LFNTDPDGSVLMHATGTCMASDSWSGEMSLSASVFDFDMAASGLQSTIGLV